MLSVLHLECYVLMWIVFLRYMQLEEIFVELTSRKWVHANPSQKRKASQAKMEMLMH